MTHSRESTPFMWRPQTLQSYVPGGKGTQLAHTFWCTPALAIIGFRMLGQSLNSAKERQRERAREREIEREGGRGSERERESERATFRYRSDNCKRFASSASARPQLKRADGCCFFNSEAVT